MRSLYRRLFITVSPLLFSVFCSGDSPLDDARHAIQMRNFDEAERILEHVLFTRPKDPDALTLACRMALLERNWRDAYAYYDSLHSSLSRHRLDVLSEICRGLLHDCIVSDDPVLREHAYAEFASFPEESTIHLFRECLSDCTQAIRRIGIRILTRMHDRQSLDHIRQFITDPDPSLRYESAASLFCFGYYPQAVPVLVRAFRMAPSGIQNEILGILRDIHNPELIPVLKSAMKSDYGLVRISAIRHLFAMGDRDARRSLMQNRSLKEYLENDSLTGAICSALLECAEEDEKMELAGTLREFAASASITQKLRIYKCIAMHGADPSPAYSVDSYLQDDRADIRLLAAEIIFYRDRARGEQELSRLYPMGIKDPEFILASGSDALMSLLKGDSQNLSLGDLRKTGIHFAERRDLNGIDMFLPYCRSNNTEKAIIAAGSILAIIQTYTRISAAPFQ